MFTQRFKLEHDYGWHLDLRDTLDSVPEGRTVHDRLIIPLKVSPFHVSQFQRGEVKACQIFTDRSGKWWVNFAVRVAIDELPDTSLPPAVLGIDLGIEKAACTTLVTPEKVRETRYFKQKDKVEIIKRYDQLVADLQRKTLTNDNPDGVFQKLRQIRHRRENTAREYDRVLVSDLLDYIEELSGKYTLYVAIGLLKNIRITAQKGNFKGRQYRGMIHSWAFARITDSLRHGLAQRGWTTEGKDSRFQVVSEAWTSIMCWKCGTKGVRPRQNYFRCPSCGHKTNADRNGAINIAGRLITLTKSLHSVRGLGKWEESVQARKRSRLKAHKKKPSQGKSLLSRKEQTSDSGESAAVHYVQSDLLGFGDDSKMSDDDLAVVSTMETLSVVGSDDPTSVQEKEARSSGGIPSR